MQRQPSPLPDPGDRSTWNRLLEGYEKEEPPPGWKIHRPGYGTYLMGLAVFGPLTLLLGGISLSSSEAGRFDCALVGAALCGLLSTFCLISLLLARKAFVLLTTEGLLVTPLLRPPVRVNWDRIDSVDLLVHQNPRQTRDTYATLEIEYTTSEGEAKKLKIDGYEVPHLRVIVEEIATYRNER